MRESSSTTSPAPFTPLHITEERLLRYLRDLKYGTVQIKVEAGLPVMIERAKEQVKLT